jgi:hypothetical protein
MIGPTAKRKLNEYASGGPSRFGKPRFSLLTHRGARVIGADTLRISVVLHVPLGYAALGKMDKDYLVLKRASASRPSGEWNDDDFDVLADGVAVGRIMKAAAVPVGMSWMWTLAFGYHEDRTPGRHGSVREELAA